MAQAVPSVDVVYLILKRWAERRRYRFYSDLSHDYAAETGHDFPAHGTCDAPLGELNRRLHASGLPALSRPSGPP